MESFNFLLFLAIILVSTKVLGIFSKKVKMPQVVGALVAGVILGPSVLNLVQMESDGNFLAYMAEIGVILLMFNAGLETDLSELKKNGVASIGIKGKRCSFLYCCNVWSYRSVSRRIYCICIILPCRCIKFS